ncbi:hypothetical protein PoB_000574400 [Plakobranchus ocellatus]|uniref:Secreted protein n=1 Tax=Plakobranchus ocellatus TaxID=259542 RepID=A0AAV3YAX9_9GAST|nr:hypothetical protein PoB_000574400 [Plakobranchus ocellatus]
MRVWKLRVLMEALASIAAVMAFASVTLQATGDRQARRSVSFRSETGRSLPPTWSILKKAVPIRRSAYKTTLTGESSDLREAPRSIIELTPYSEN